MDVCVKCHENPCECHRDARPRGFLDGPPPPEALPSHIVDRTTSELCKQNRYLIEEVGRLHEQNKQLLILLARVEWIMDQETGKMVCPRCRGWRTHANDCDISQALQ